MTNNKKPDWFRIAVFTAIAAAITTNAITSKYSGVGDWLIVAAIWSLVIYAVDYELHVWDYFWSVVAQRFQDKSKKEMHNDSAR